MSHVDPTPVVSVAIPVYNGSRWIGQTIESILGQTYTDLELVIVDNASTDNTVAVCEDYKLRDSRIVIHKNHENIGAAPNFNVAFERSRGKYFKWSSSNDLIGENFLQLCVDILEESLEFVAVCPKTQLINDENEVIEQCLECMHFGDELPFERFNAYLERVRLNNIEQALMRRDMLAKTALQKTYPNSDTILMAEVAARGKIYEIPEFLLSRRLDKSSSTQFMSEEGVKAYYASGTRIPNRTLGMFWGLASIATRVPMSLAQRVKFYRYAWRFLVWARSELMQDFGLKAKT